MGNSRRLRKTRTAPRKKYQEFLNFIHRNKYEFQFLFIFARQIGAKGLAKGGDIRTVQFITDC